MTDLPFSNSFCLVGDRLTILNDRILLVGLAAGNGNEAFAAIADFQALGTAIEGSYTVGDAEHEKEAPKKRPVISKPVFTTVRERVIACIPRVTEQVWSRGGNGFSIC